MRTWVIRYERTRAHCHAYGSRLCTYRLHPGRTEHGSVNARSWRPVGPTRRTQITLSARLRAATLATGLPTITAVHALIDGSKRFEFSAFWGFNGRQLSLANDLDRLTMIARSCATERAGRHGGPLRPRGASAASP